MLEQVGRVRRRPCRNSRPAAMRRSSSDPSSASDLRTTEASKACENSRPIAAPTCAASLAGPSRSSRAISDACRLSGIARAGDGTAATVRRAAPSLSASITAFVISSTNSGMPSVRSTIPAITSAGSPWFPTRRAMMAVASRSPSRLSVRLVTCDCPTHGALNSGRKVTMSSTRRVLMRSTVRPNASRLVGSVQCASSKIISTGCWLANRASCSVSASNVRCLRCSGIKSSAGYRPSFGSDSISARSAASWVEVEVCARRTSSLSSFACGVSSCVSPAARSIWPMIG